MNYYLEVLKKYAVFTGRADRPEFWYFGLFSIIISVVLDIIGGFIGIGYLSFLYLLGVLLPLVGVGIRRMHDIGKSGWFYIIPFYNLYLAAMEGENGSNQYGADPRNPNMEAADQLS